MNASRYAVLVLAGILIGACSPESKQTQNADATRPSATTSSPTQQPPMVVYKSASCGCCKAWIAHMKQNGFSVTANDVDNMNPIKERVGIPAGMGSCHTGEVAGYFIEGHVPAEDVKRLLQEKPDAKGLTVPRMPIGSPGMESGDHREPYDVLLVHKDGSTSVFAHHGDK